MYQEESPNAGNIQKEKHGEFYRDHMDISKVTFINQIKYISNEQNKVYSKYLLRFLFVVFVVHMCTPDYLKQPYYKEKDTH